MRERTACELLELVARECPQIARAFAGGGIEDAVRRARLAAGLSVPIGAIEMGGARPSDPRVEPEDATRPPRHRRSSSTALAAASSAAQHAEAARAHLDQTINAIGETAKRAAAIDD